MSRPGPTGSRTDGPRPASVSGTAASHSGSAGGIADDEVRGGPEPVLVERVPADRERVVDPDRLARDLRTVPVDRQVRREVAGLATREAGRLEAAGSSPAAVPASRSAGPSATRPSGTTRPCSSPSRDVTAAATRNRIRPRWVSSVAIFVYWWRSP